MNMYLHRQTLYKGTHRGILIFEDELKCLYDNVISAGVEIFEQ